MKHAAKDLIAALVLSFLSTSVTQSQRLPKKEKRPSQSSETTQANTVSAGRVLIR